MILPEWPRACAACWNASGRLAIMTSEMDPELIGDLARRGIPIVFLDVGKVRDRISNIYVDYAKGIREAVEHLIAWTPPNRVSATHELKSAGTRKSAVRNAECLWPC